MLPPGPPFGITSSLRSCWIGAMQWLLAGVAASLVEEAVALGEVVAALGALEREELGQVALFRTKQGFIPITVRYSERTETSKRR